MKFKMKWAIKDGDIISPSDSSIKVDLNDIIRQVQDDDNLKVITEYPKGKDVIMADCFNCKHRMIGTVTSLSCEYVEVEITNEIIGYVIYNMQDIFRINPIFTIRKNKADVIALMICYYLNDKYNYV